MSQEYRNKFRKRKVDYKKAVDTFFMSRGIACICCNVTGTGDIINNYSVPGYEMLNESLVSYINTVIGYLFYENRGIENERIRSAQLVTMKVIFRERFLDRDFTDEEVREILSDVTSNAESTEI